MAEKELNLPKFACGYPAHESARPHRIRTPAGKAHYVGIDPANNAMHNVSIWETLADADQMSSFAPMLALGAEFTALGVRFERPILNCNTLWQLDNK